MALISVQEYARRRGVSPTAVRQAIKAGRIASAVRQKNPVRLDLEAADAAWAANTRKEAEGDASDYNMARASKVQADAEFAKLRLDELRGDVLRLPDVRALWFRHLRGLRDRLEAIADREAAALSAAGTPAECRIIVQTAIRQALAEVPAEAPVPPPPAARA